MFSTVLTRKQFILFYFFVLYTFKIAPSITIQITIVVETL